MKCEGERNGLNIVLSKIRFFLKNLCFFHVVFVEEQIIQRDVVKNKTGKWSQKLEKNIVQKIASLSKKCDVF